MNQSKGKNMNQENNKPKEYFYFDLADESHEKILEKELKEASENPLGPLNDVTEVEY